jgi:hypothetical protein
MQELVDLMAGDIGQDAAIGILSKNQSGRVARFRRCGPSPTV